VSVSLCKKIVSFGDDRMLLNVLLIFFVIPTTNTQLMINNFYRIIHVTQINESLLGLIFMNFVVMFGNFLLVKYNFFDLVLLELIIQLFYKVSFFIHLVSIKFYRKNIKIYSSISNTFFIYFQLMDNS